MLRRSAIASAARLLSLAIILSSCSGREAALAPVSRHAFKTQYHPASLPAVTAEYTLATLNATPRGVLEAADGSILFAEEYGHALGRVTLQGAVIEVPIAAFPAEMTLDSLGNLWFTEPLLGDSVVNVLPSGQVTRYTIPSVGATEPFPTGIAAQPSVGAVWFTDPGTNTIGRIDSSGTVSTFNAPGSPTGIALGSDNAWYFTEVNGDHIGRMDTSGNLTNQYPVPTKNNLPSGITAGPTAGTIWFTETGCLVKGPAECVSGKIGQLSGGAITEYDAQSDPVSITVGDDGNLWFTASFANKLGRVTPAGVVTLFPVPTPNSEPFDITKGPNRTMWFSERAAGKIGVLSY